MYKFLLHTCCAPCFCHPFEMLKDEYEITAYYYNPNISPRSEYVARFNELVGYSKVRGFDVVEGEYDIRKWTAAVKDYRFLGEKTERCRICYRVRMEKTFQYAAENGFDLAGTCLSISPHKIAQWINEIGLEIQEKYGVKFFVADFKKQDGFRKSVELSHKYEFYRQNYCGCVYSRLERDSDSRWKEISDKKKAYP